MVGLAKRKLVTADLPQCEPPQAAEGAEHEVHQPVGTEHDIAYGRQ